MRKVALSLMALAVLATACKKKEVENDPVDPTPEPVVEGCTDQTANNYNSDATKDDGTCTFDPVLGPNEMQDDRDQIIYKTVDINGTVWMAENLAYNVAGSTVYENVPANEEIYGRLYTYADAQNACPTGWHLSTKLEWDDLLSHFSNDALKIMEGGLSGVDIKLGGFQHLSDNKFHMENEAGFYHGVINTTQYYEMRFNDGSSLIEESPALSSDSRRRSVRCVKD